MTPPSPPPQNSKLKGSHSDGFTCSFPASFLPGNFEEVSHFIQMLCQFTERISSPLSTKVKSSGFNTLQAGKSWRGGGDQLKEINY